MAKGLKETNVDISLGGSPEQGGGIRQGTDDKLLQAPYLLELVNGELGKDGSVRRRWPANELPDDGISDRAKQNLNSVFNHGGSALVVNTNLGPHVYTPGTGWTDTGEFGQPPCEVRDRRAVPSKNWYADSAVSDDYVVYIQAESDGIWLTAYEYSTNALAVPRTLIASGSTLANPKVIAHPTTGLFHVAWMTGPSNDNVVMNSYSSANFPATPAVNSATIFTTSDQYELALGATGFVYVAAGRAAHTLDVVRVVESTYATSGSQSVATVGASGGLGLWYNATQATLYAAAFDAAVDAADAKTAYFNAALSTQAVGSDFTLLPSTYSDVGFAGFVASFAYSGNGDGQMLMVLSTICYYDVPGLSGGPPNYQAEGALGQHGCTQAFVVGTALTNISTVKPVWNYYLSTRLWNPTTNASRPLFGLLRLNTAANQSSGSTTADTFFYQEWQSLQTTMFVCSYGVLPTADAESYTRNISVVARCQDDSAANPQPFAIAVSSYPFTSTPSYYSRLAGVSVVSGTTVSFARAVYSSFSIRDVQQPPTSVYEHVYQGLQGVYGQLMQTEFQWQCTPRSKDSVAQMSSVSAGYQGYFDGTGSYENTPHSYPEVVDRPFQLQEDPGGGDVQIPFYFEATDITGGVVDTDYAATHNLNVVFVWAWVDAYGNLHRSAPSSRHNSNGMRGITRTNGVYTIDMYVTDLPLSAIPATAERRYLEVYVTGDVDVDPVLRLAVTLPYEPQSGGQTPRDTVRPWLLHIVPTLNELESDGMSPYSQAPGLYTEGDVLESSAPPAFIGAVSTKDRLWGLAANAAWFSKPLEPGVAPEFNGNLTIPMLTGVGDCVAIAALDEKVIVFKQSSIFVITGDGPNATGGGNPFPVPQSVSTDVGCIAPTSVVRGPFGVVFQGKSGLYLLDRGLNLTWIGKQVENLVSSTPVVCGVLVPEQSHVRWVVDATGLAVVWNYDMNQWGTYEGSKEKHGVVYSTGWVGLLDALELEDESLCYFAQERPTAPDELANYIEAPFPISFTTAWVKTAGIQGLVRIKRALVLCDVGTFPSFFNAHNGLSVGVQYNYDPSTVSSYAWSGAEPLPWTPQYEMHLQYQKCESLRFVVSEVGAADGAVMCPGTVFSGITLRVGTRGVPFKYFPQGNVR